MLVGSDPAGGQRFTGLLQDVRLYGAPLNRSQLHELHAQPARADLRGVSGYLRYRQDERNKSFVVEVRDDGEEEGEELFYLQLVAAQGGARLPWPRPTATLRVMKSDGANGLFGFTGACIPEVGGVGGVARYPRPFCRRFEFALQKGLERTNTFLSASDMLLREPITKLAFPSGALLAG